MSLRSLFARAALVPLLVALIGCRDYRAIRLDDPDGSEDAGDAGDAGEEDGGEDAGDAGDAGFDAGTDGGRPGCMPGIQYIFTFSGDRTLRRFEPSTLKFETVGTLKCEQQGSPFSMAVARSGEAWVEYLDGKIFRVNTTNAACEATPYVPQPVGAPFRNFGMGFAAADPSSAEDTLYVSDFEGWGLATLDTTTYQLTTIGPYSFGTAAELTGTNDGQLYGGFLGTPFQLVHLDQASGAFLSQVPLTSLAQMPGGGSNFAMAAYGTDFWFFLGNGEGTDIYQYSPSTDQAPKRRTHVAIDIVGAGVSTCASQ